MVAILFRTPFCFTQHACLLVKCDSYTNQTLITSNKCFWIIDDIWIHCPLGDLTEILDIPFKFDSYINQTLITSNKCFWIIDDIWTHCPLGDLTEILHITFKFVYRLIPCGLQSKIVGRWMPQSSDECHRVTWTLILVQVMAWCHKAANHYLSQCLSRSILPYGDTRPQWVNVISCNMSSFHIK